MPTGIQPTTGTDKSPATLLAIALFKLIKGVLLIIAGIGALKLLHRDVAETVLHWIDILRVDPDNRLIHSLLASFRSPPNNWRRRVRAPLSMRLFC
jgi:hypothetical protein